MSQRPRFPMWLALGLAILCLCLASPVSAQIMTVRQNVHHDVSPAVRDLPTITSHTLRPPHEAEPARRIPMPANLKAASEPDTVLQRTVALAPTLHAPTTGLNFEGLGNGSLGFTPNAAPPDTNGAVGATQYVQWVNESFAVFDKATGNLLAGPTAGNALWSGFGAGCQANNDGDPVVLYDKAAQRYAAAVAASYN